MKTALIILAFFSVLNTIGLGMAIATLLKLSDSIQQQLGDFETTINQRIRAFLSVFNKKREIEHLENKEKL